MKKFKKIIKIFSVVLIIFSIFFCFIVATNTHHIDECNDTDCNICNLICIAVNITKTIFNINVLFFICIFISYLHFKIFKEVLVFRNNSLFFQKVKLNE